VHKVLWEARRHHNADQPLETVLPASLARFVRRVQIGGRAASLHRDRPRSVAMRVVALAFGASVKEVSRAIAADRRNVSRKS
jgi:hypothetical protein